MNVYIYLAVLSASCLYALARGGAPERLGVLILLSAVAATIFSPRSNSFRFEGIELAVLMIDTVMLIAVIVLALRAQRYWPMWWAGIKVNSIVTHLMMLAPTVMPWPYSVMSALLSYPSPLLLAIGTARHRSRVRKYGNDPAWNTWEGHDERRIATLSERG